MCVGIPMQVLATRPGSAVVVGRGEQRDVSTLLVDPPVPGDWLLVFLDTARESITGERADEVNAALDLLEAALTGAPPGAPGFELPSAVSADQLRSLVAPDSPT
ncbi:MAG: HypC/HybG/HupF family hydrogenase formation chaperone [Burkholderiales bacterium]